MTGVPRPDDVTRAQHVLSSVATRLPDRPGLLGEVYALARRRRRHRRVAAGSALMAFAVVSTLGVAGVLPASVGIHRGGPAAVPVSSPAPPTGTTAAPTGTAVPTGTTAPTWVDEFAGTTLDRARWTYVYDEGANTEIGAWSAANVGVAAGTLRLAVRRTGTALPAATSGGIGAAGSAATTGRWQVRWRMPAGPGVIGQLALVAEKHPDRQPRYLATLIPGEHKLNLADGAGHHLDLAADPAAYQTVALELTPTETRWYVDGKPVATWPRPAATADAVWPALQTLQTDLDCGATALPADCGGRRAAYPALLQVDALTYWRQPARR
jgi:hypothetical protein